MTARSGRLPKITSEEVAAGWLQELARKSAHNDRGLTSKEWAKMLGVHRDTFLEQLGKANELGWVRRGMRTGEDVAGRRRQDYVYWIERPKK